MNTKLKPCPFCGGKARYGQQLDLDSGSFKKWVMCTECKSCTGRSENRAEVTRAWNRRKRNADTEKETRTKIYNEILDSFCNCLCGDLKHCTNFGCTRHNILAIVDGERWYKEINENPRYRIWLGERDTYDE